MSILSKQPDGFGFYYGYKDGDYRQINVRQEMNWFGYQWYAYVGGIRIPGSYGCKDHAEEAALKYMEDNPDGYTYEDDC